MCVMMTEIKIIEGGQKRCLLTRGDQIKKNKKIKNNATLWGSSPILGY